MPDGQDRYRFSNTVPWISTGPAIAATSILVGLAGMGYGWLACLALPAVLQLTLTIAFGCTLGWLTATPMQLAHVRHPRAVALCAAALACVAHGVGWFVWLAAIVTEAGGDVGWGLLTPAGLTNLLADVAQRGVWRVNSMNAPIHGASLWCIWLIELVLIVALAARVAFRRATRTPYCEQCNRWTVQQRGVALRGTQRNALTTLLALPKGNCIERLLALPAPRTSDHCWVTADVHQCPRCEAFQTLTLRRLERGLVRIRATTLRHHQPIDHNMFSALQKGRIAPMLQQDALAPGRSAVPKSHHQMPTNRV